MDYYYTKKGLELKQRQIKFQEEKVKSVGREAGEEAGISCDWHDNFGYEDAKRRLEMESGVLKRLKDEAQGAILVKIEKQSQRVMIGVTVKVSVDGTEKEFTIGAYGESDPGRGLVSYSSPLGHALLNMEVGDGKNVSIGGRTVELEVLSIDPPSSKYYQLVEQLFSALDDRLGEADGRT
jgi:transcription elongation GreA/GreB family factor